MSFTLSVTNKLFMMNELMLNAVKLSVIMLNVVTPIYTLLFVVQAK
jgi:hypothetical protein